MKKEQHEMNDKLLQNSSRRRRKRRANSASNLYEPLNHTPMVRPFGS
jgi:hypothetical protein